MSTQEKTTETTESQETETLVICDIQKSETEVTRISASPYKGVWYVHLRNFFKDRETGEYRPKKQHFSVRKDLLPDLVKGILKAEQTIHARL